MVQMHELVDEATKEKLRKLRDTKFALQSYKVRKQQKENRRAKAKTA